MNHANPPSRTRQRLWTAVAVVGAFGIGATLFAPVGAHAKEKAIDVIVGNGPSNPVVVSGSVTGTVDANITNTVPITGSVSANVVNTVPIVGNVNATVTNTIPVTGTVDVAGTVTAQTQRTAFTCRVSVSVAANTVGASVDDACPDLTSNRQFVVTQSEISAFSIADFPEGATVRASVLFFDDGNSPANASLAFATVRDPDVEDNFFGYEAVGQRTIYGGAQSETWLHPMTFGARVRVQTNFVSQNDTSVTVKLSGYSTPKLD